MAGTCSIVTLKASFFFVGGKTCLMQVRNINKGTKANNWVVIKNRHLVFN